jgi:hypothetical protein
MGIPAKRIIELTRNLSTITQHLDELGIRVEIGDDFAEYRAQRVQQADRGQIYPMFDVASSYIDQKNGFWVCGYDSSGDLVHTQAVLRLDMSGMTLGSHLRTHRHKYITPDSTPDPDQTFYEGPDALDAISGDVCYHGEFWLRARGLGGPRSQGATSLLSRVLIEVMIAAWKPHYVFALVPRSLAEKGAHLRYGYTHCEPGRWLGPDQQVTEEDYLIWMNADDMASAIAREPQGLKRPARIEAVKTPLASVSVASDLDATASNG